MMKCILSFCLILSVILLNECIIYEEPTFTHEELEDYFQENLNYVVHIIKPHSKTCFYEHVKTNGTMKYQAEVELI